MPKIQFSRQWRVLKGMAYGLQQSTMLGQMHLTELSDLEQEQACTLMAELLEEPMPEFLKQQSGTEGFAKKLIHWVGALQRQSNIAVSRTFRVNKSPGLSGNTATVFQVALPIVSSRTATIAIEWVTKTINALISGESQNRLPTSDAWADSVKEITRSLRKLADEGVNDFHILQAINRLNIPIQRPGGRLILLGTGCHVRWMSSTITDATNPLGVDLAGDKLRTASFLNALGFPGARHRLVRNGDEAIQAARDLGYPVVVKPANLEKGMGVYADLPDEKRLRHFFEITRSITDLILVEKHVAGNTHRLTVFQGELIRADKRIPGGVTGDGTHNIAQLIAYWNQRPEIKRRTLRLGKTLLSLDDEALDLLAQDNRPPDYIPAPNEFVRLRRRDNINTGGVNEHLLLEQVHPDNQQLALDVANMLRMDFVGIDFIISDISRSWLDVGGLICEINAQPQMGIGKDEAIYEKVLTKLLGGEFTVPAHLLIYSGGKQTEEVLLKMLGAEEQCNGVSSELGIWINNKQVSARFKDGFQAARALSIRPNVTGMICLMKVEEVFANGLPLHSWDSIRIVGARISEEIDTSVLENLRSMLGGHIRSRNSSSIQTSHLSMDSLPVVR